MELLVKSFMALLGINKFRFDLNFGMKTKKIKFKI